MWAVTFGTARRAWAGCSCTKCDSPPINGQCTNTVLLYDDPLLYGFNVAIKGLIGVVIIQTMKDRARGPSRESDGLTGLFAQPTVLVVDWLQPALTRGIKLSYMPAAIECRADASNARLMT